MVTARPPGIQDSIWIDRVGKSFKGDAAAQFQRLKQAGQLPDAEECRILQRWSLFTAWMRDKFMSPLPWRRLGDNFRDLRQGDSRSPRKWVLALALAQHALNSIYNIARTERLPIPSGTEHIEGNHLIRKVHRHSNKKLTTLLHKKNGRREMINWTWIDLRRFLKTEAENELNPTGGILGNRSITPNPQSSLLVTAAAGSRRRQVSVAPIPPVVPSLRRAQTIHAEPQLPSNFNTPDFGFPPNRINVVTDCSWGHQSADAYEGCMPVLCRPALPPSR